jgi:hypothetical protein
MKRARQIFAIAGNLKIVILDGGKSESSRDAEDSESEDIQKIYADKTYDNGRPTVESLPAQAESEFLLVA